jgi:hypothetical protein
MKKQEVSIEYRKIKLVEAFVQLSDLQTIEKLENILHQKKSKNSATIHKPLSEKSLHILLEKAENDSKKGKTKAAQKLKKEIAATWR